MTYNFNVDQKSLFKIEQFHPHLYSHTKSMQFQSLNKSEKIAYKIYSCHNRGVTIKKNKINTCELSAIESQIKREGQFFNMQAIESSD